MDVMITIVRKLYLMLDNKGHSHPCIYCTWWNAIR